MFKTDRDRIEEAFFPRLLINEIVGMRAAPDAAGQAGDNLHRAAEYSVHEALRGLDRSSMLRLADRTDRVVARAQAVYTPPGTIPNPDTPAHRFITGVRLLRRTLEESRFTPTEGTLLQRFCAGVVSILDAADMEYEAERGDAQIERMLHSLVDDRLFGVRQRLLDRPSANG